MAATPAPTPSQRTSAPRQRRLQNHHDHRANWDRSGCFKRVKGLPAAILLILAPLASADSGRLTGNWGGARNTLENRGVVPFAQYVSGVWSNLRGGIDTGTRSEGLAFLGSGRRPREAGRLATNEFSHRLVSPTTEDNRRVTSSEASARTRSAGGKQTTRFASTTSTSSASFSTARCWSKQGSWPLTTTSSLAASRTPS